ncbi:STAS domain-containing protein, partial [Micromonospora sp. WMMD736]|uniref:STAS domain-containing protein n=1 Tax=Micromonospora sp. WMMD736 TaxID=3404112 RepID=UPI003B92A1D6
PGPGPSPTDCLTAQFTTHQLSSVAVVTVAGEVDAANAQAFIDYVTEQAAHVDSLVLDLTGVDFFATAGFSALHTISVQCAGAAVGWALVPSRAVDRVLEVCDPDSTLVRRGTVEDAAARLKDEPRPLLQLVAESG